MENQDFFDHRDALAKDETYEQQANETSEKPLSGGYASPTIPRLNGNFIITAVQNNTDLNGPFFAILKEMAESYNATIVCCPILYNKNAWAQPDNPEESGAIWFEPAVKPFMVEDRVILNDDVLLIGNAHVLPTAKNPLSGFSSAGEAGQTIVIPASKIALECQAALKGETGKTLISTGTLTLMSYIQRKAGVCAELEHNYGAVIVQEGKPVRSVEFLNGAVFDFDGKDVRRFGDEFFPMEPVLTLGDIHAEKCPQERIKKLVSIIEKVWPSQVVCHDLLDFMTRNHHSRGNHFFRYEHDKAGGSVANDVKTARKLLERLDNGAAAFNIVESNHDLALERWLNESDYRSDTINAETYLKLALAKVKAIKKGLSFNAFEFMMKGCKARVKFNGTDQSLIFYGVEHGHHGDLGPNGARGSISAFRKLGQRMVIGHSHTPGISGGVYQVGVSGSLDMGYNSGPSSWRHAHCLTYPNGQCQIIFED